MTRNDIAQGRTAYAMILWWVERQREDNEQYEYTGKTSHGTARSGGDGI